RTGLRRRTSGCSVSHFGSVIEHLQGPGDVERTSTDSRSAHPAHTAAGDDHVDYSLSADRGGAALLEAGARYTGHSVKSLPDRSCSVSYDPDHAASGDRHLHERLGAHGERDTHSGTGF